MNINVCAIAYLYHCSVDLTKLNDEHRNKTVGFSGFFNGMGDYRKFSSYTSGGYRDPIMACPSVITNNTHIRTRGQEVSYQRIFDRAKGLAYWQILWQKKKKDTDKKEEMKDDGTPKKVHQEPLD